MVGGRSTPRSGRFTSQKRPGTHCTGGWVGLEASLDGNTISPSLWFEPLTVQPVVSKIYLLLINDNTILS